MLFVRWKWFWLLVVTGFLIGVLVGAASAAASRAVQSTINVRRCIVDANGTPTLSSDCLRRKPARRRSGSPTDGR